MEFSRSHPIGAETCLSSLRTQAQRPEAATAGVHRKDRRRVTAHRSSYRCSVEFANESRPCSTPFLQVYTLVMLAQPGTGLAGKGRSTTTESGDHS